MVKGPRKLASKVAERLGGGDIGAESAWSFLLEICTLAGTILSFTLLGHSLGPKGYGAYASLYALIGPFVTLAASGSTLALLQHTLREKEPLASASRSCLSISLLLGLMLVPASGLAADHFVHNLNWLAILSILSTEFLAAPVVQLAATTVQAGQGFIAATKIRLILVALRAIALVALYSAGRLTVAAFGLSSLSLSAALGLTLLLRVGNRHQFRYVPGRMYARHLKSNVAYSLGISAFSFQNDGDKTVLAANKFVVDTGLYAAAYRMAQMGMLPMSSVVNATHQRFLHHEEGVKGQHLKRAISFSMVTAAYGALFIVGVMVFAPLLPLIIGQSFKGSVTMLRWLSPLVLLRTLSIFPVNGLMGLGKTMLRTVLIILNAILSMALYILLIPKYSWKGGVAGTLIGETVLVGSMWTALVIMQRRADREVDLAAALQPATAQHDPEAFDLPDTIIGGSAVPGSVVTDDDARGAEHAPDATQ